MNDKPSTTPRKVDWRGADMRGVSMAGVDLEGADLRAADLRGVNFAGSNLRYADLRGASVQGACFQNASLYGAKMQGVEAYQADFRGCDLRHANFGGAYPEGRCCRNVPPLPKSRGAAAWSGQDGGNAGNATPPPEKTWRSVKSNRAKSPIRRAMQPTIRTGSPAAGACPMNSGTRGEAGDGQRTP